MNKRAIEVGINFIVILIIAIVVFGLGLNFAFKFFKKAEEFREEIDQRTRQEIESLIVGGGAKVAIYPTQVTLYGGQKATIGIGILNVLDAEKTFSLNVECSKRVSDSTVEDCDKDKMRAGFFREHTIKPNEHQITSALITNNGAPPGTYIINIKVEYGSPPISYGDEVYKVYVRVP